MAIIKGMARFPMVHAQDVSDKLDSALENVVIFAGRWGGNNEGELILKVEQCQKSWKWKEKYRETCTDIRYGVPCTSTE